MRDCEVENWLHVHTFTINLTSEEPIYAMVKGVKANNDWGLS